MGDLLEHRLKTANTLAPKLNEGDAANRIVEARMGSLAAGATCGINELPGDVRPVLEAQADALVAEIARAFSADFAPLVRAFGISRLDQPRVGGVALSDPHHGGRMCAIVEVGSHKLVYKPRSVAGHGLFNDLVEIVSAEVDTAGLATVCSVDAADHGWVELIEPRECLSSTEVASYHRNFGMLVALADALGTSDLHYGNVIAVGPGLAVVDWETLLQPARRSEAKQHRPHSIESGRAALRDSVLATGLLPAAGRKNGQFVDESALWGDEPGPHRCRLDGEFQSPVTWLGDLLGGFDDMTRAVDRVQERFSETGGPLDEARTLPTRFVVRATASYRGLGARGLSVPAAHRGAWYRQKLDMPAAQPAELAAAFADIEAQSLAQFDIPRFTVDAGAVDLELGQRTWRGVFPVDAVTRARDRLTSRHDERAKSQRRLLKLSVIARSIDHARPVLEAPTRQFDRNEEVEPSLHHAMDEIFDKLSDYYNDSAGWFTVRQFAPGRFRPAPATASFDEGTIGIAALLRRSRAESQATMLTDQVLSALRTAISGTSCQPGELDLGLQPRTAYGAALLGADGIDWLWHWSASLLEQLPSATDLYSGAAGVVIASAERLAHAAGEDGEQMSRLVSHTDRLIERPQLDDQGLAHGRAGVAMALARASRVTGLDRHVAISHSLRAALGDRPGVAGGAITWCSGDAGMVLARVAIASDLECHADDDVIASLASSLCERPLGDLDHLCCGELGVVEAITEAGRHLDDQELLRAGRRRLNAVVTRRSARGGWALLPGTVGYEPVGMMQGLAGIGYGLLRQTDPTVPSILALRV